MKHKGVGMNGDEVRATVVGDVLTIQMGGRFDFGCHQEFRKAYESVTGKFKDCVVDLAVTEYIDSAALGMLLVLRESIGGGRIRVTNSRPAVRRILQIANFTSLFAIE